MWELLSDHSGMISIQTDGARMNSVCYGYFLNWKIVHLVHATQAMEMRKWSIDVKCICFQNIFESMSKNKKLLIIFPIAIGLALDTNEFADLFARCKIQVAIS